MDFDWLNGLVISPSGHENLDVNEIVRISSKIIHH